ncbi:hypothetical protein QIS74_05577 [Colletotrichum tabaci]|uniref:Uncharacterized protein n=1 Tax=Colletotrichum tabaci TaxID=1209068 RepID=A0AAV9TFE4_9PEZI
MRDTVVMEYKFLKTFLGLLVLMDLKGSVQDKTITERAWRAYVRLVYNSTMKLQGPASAKNIKDEKDSMKQDSALESIQLDLQSLSSMTRRAGQSIAQQAVRTFKLKTVPPPMSTEAAMHGLTNNHEYASVRMCALAIWRNQLSVDMMVIESSNYST